MGIAVGTLALPALGGGLGTLTGGAFAGLVGTGFALEGSELGLVAAGGGVGGAAAGSMGGAAAADLLYNDGENLKGLSHQQTEHAYNPYE